jgi:hypothetical protein
MDMDVVGNKERLLKGILDGEATTDIEPASREERLLKAILENGGGGGGGATSVTLAASGDNLSGDISLADLKTALSNGVVLLSFPTDGNADERVVAEYTDDSTNGLRIGVFSEEEYIVYSVVDDGNDGATLTGVSEKGLPLTIELGLTSQTGGTIDNADYSTIKRAILAGSPLTISNTYMGGVIRPIATMIDPEDQSIAITFPQFNLTVSVDGVTITGMILTMIRITPDTPTQWSIYARGTI